ncbi:MAG TPA: twin-arginine translocase subunit TatC [Gaiellaceae bacterium]|nr:twin-arginine translocase subunit TatC [Gaiellaceae bacterium]
MAHGQEVELVGHLEELRSRIFIAGGAILATSIFAFTIHRRVIRLLVDQLPVHHRHLLTLGITEPFTTSLKVSIALGFALALPIVLWQLWSFLAPAITPKTQHGIVGFTLFAGALMIGGIAFGYKIALPAALHFLTNYDNSVYNVQIRASDFISFAVLVLAACGAVFELPIVVLGLVRVKALSSAKLRRNRKIGYMIVCCVGVALPGVDPVTTTMETIPLLILFESSIWLAVAFEKRWFAPLAAVEGT